MDNRFNTIAGWVLFSGIIALGLSIVSTKFFHAGSPERPEQMGYPIAGVVEEGGGDAGPDLGTLIAEATIDQGQAVFAKCTACHTIEQGGANGIGPNLYGIMGQPIGQHVAGFAYSSALSDKGGDWSWENMDAWLANPRGFASGTKMSFAGLSKPEDRAAVMVYMESYGGAPARPEPVVAEEEPVEEGLDGAGEGPGAVEGGDVDPVEAAGAMGAPQPVPGQGAAANNDGATKIGD